MFQHHEARGPWGLGSRSEDPGKGRRICGRAGGGWPEAAGARSRGPVPGGLGAKPLSPWGCPLHPFLKEASCLLKYTTSENFPSCFLLHYQVSISTGSLPSAYRDP